MRSQLVLIDLAAGRDLLGLHSRSGKPVTYDWASQTKLFFLDFRPVDRHLSVPFAAGKMIPTSK
jgi:hypothetical protein